MDQNSTASTPRIVVLSGPSGTGKTTVVRRLTALHPPCVTKAISATTRPPRPGESDGIDYHFLTPEQFTTNREQGRFLETAEVFGTGTWYGTLRSEVEQFAGTETWVLLEIDVRGALAIRDQFPQCVMIFLRAESEQEYERRLRGRATETEEAVIRRLERMREELQYATCYDYQVVNDDVDRATARIGEILLQRESGGNA